MSLTPGGREVCDHHLLYSELLTFYVYVLGSSLKITIVQGFVAFKKSEVKNVRTFENYL